MNRFGAAVAAAVVGLAAVAWNSVAAAQSRPIVIDTRAVTESSQTAFAELAHNADLQGRVRVIARLAIGPSQNGGSAKEHSAERRGLHDIQQSVIQRGSIAQGDATLFETIPYLSAFVTKAQLTHLMHDPDVASIQEDVPERQLASPSKKGAATTTADNIELIGAPDVWARGITGKGQVVALLDTGVDFRHPALKRKVVAGLCRSTNNYPIYKSLCPKAVTSSNTLLSSRPCTLVGCESGTGAASVVAEDNVDLKGVAPGAKIISAQVFSRLTGTLCPYGQPCPKSFVTDQISALEQVYSLRQQYHIAAVVLNVQGNAWGGTCDTDLRAVIIKKLYLANIPTITGSGTGLGLDWATEPGCISQAVTVGASTLQDQIWQYSAHSLMVDLMAPGENISAAVPGGGYDYFSGTGIAAAHVAGAIALLKQFRPHASAYQIVNALRNTGVPVNHYEVPSLPEGWPTGITQMRIDVAKALTRLGEMLPAAKELPTAR